MWPFSKRPELPGMKLTPEDLQTLTKAYETTPEIFRFLLGMREQRRKSLDFAPVLKTEADIYAHGLRCHDIQRDIKLLTALAEMPITAKKAVDKFKMQTEPKEQPKEEPWEVPFVPEEEF